MRVLTPKEIFEAFVENDDDDDDDEEDEDDDEEDPSEVEPFERCFLLVETFSLDIVLLFDFDFEPILLLPRLCPFSSVDNISGCESE